MNNIKKLGQQDIMRFLDSIFEGDLHAKRVLSIANAVLGVIVNASLSIFSIGQGLALARGLNTKHAVKQVDRLLSNQSINVSSFFSYWIPFIIGQRKSIIVAMDWTDFDRDNHAVIAINLVTTHGRATPLLWKTVGKSDLKNNRNRYEDELLSKLKDAIPNDLQVMVLADRGFGDQKLFEFLEKELGFDYVIRIRGNITITDEKLEDSRAAQDWVGTNGRAKKLKNAFVTQNLYQVGAVVCVHRKQMKEPWCLVSNKMDIKSNEAINLYGKRWSIEPNFRDTKDAHFGMGMEQARIKSKERRDRLLLIGAMATALLTLLGAAGESLGYDRMLKVNTVKRRVQSLYRQGVLLYQLIPTMPKEKLHPLMTKYAELLKEQKVFDQALGFI